jgi:DNA-binding transcriptional MerR regulator
MKTLGIVWKVIINIITTAVVLGIFSIASSKFETIVLAVLVLIYLSITGFSTIWALRQIEFSEALDKELKDIKKLIKDPKGDLAKEEMDKIRNTLGFNDDFVSELPQEIDEYEKEAQKERAENKKTLMIKFYINAGFQTLIYIITLYNLLTALNS